MTRSKRAQAVEADREGNGPGRCFRAALGRSDPASDEGRAQNSITATLDAIAENLHSPSSTE